MARMLELTNVSKSFGGLLVIEPGVMHDVRALADSAFLLSMPWSEHAEG